MKKTVLIVDDSTTIRALIQVHLAGLGLDFIEASDGISALQIAQQHQPTLVIADLKMPQMNGFELCRSIRADKNLKHIPLILLTSSASDDIKASAASAGVSHYLTKPINGPLLSQVVHQCLSQTT